jgi:hypothetical protein
MPIILEGACLTLESIKAACRHSANKKGANKKGMKRILWIERLAIVIEKNGDTREVCFFVEKNVLWGEQLRIVKFLMTEKEIALWVKVEFLPLILPID